MNQLLKRYTFILVVVSALIPGNLIAQTPVADTLLRDGILTLEQSRQAALAQNKKILIQNDSIQIAKLGIERAKTGALPSVDGTGTAIHFGHPLNKILPKYTESVSGSVFELIYNGGKVRTNVKLAETNADVQQLLLTKNKADLIVSTDSTYWQIVYIKQQVLSYLQSKQYLSAALKDVTSRFNAGTNFKNDVLQVQIQYNNNELRLQRAQDSLELAKLNLLQLTGYPMDADFDVPDTVTCQPVLLEPGLTYDSLVNNRPETKVLQKQVETADLQIKLARADMLPKVSATAYGSYSHSGKGGITSILGTLGGGGTPIITGSDHNTSWLALASVSVPVFYWGNYKKQVTQYKLRANAARSQYEDVKEKLVLEVHQSWYAVKQAQLNIGLSDLTLQQATENLRLSTKRLQAGTILTTDWLQAQSTWQQSYSQAVQAKVLYNISVTRFQKATGELQ